MRKLGWSHLQLVQRRERVKSPIHFKCVLAYEPTSFCASSSLKKAGFCRGKFVYTKKLFVPSFLYGLFVDYRKKYEVLLLSLYFTKIFARKLYFCKNYSLEFFRLFAYLLALFLLRVRVLITLLNNRSLSKLKTFTWNLWIVYWYTLLGFSGFARTVKDSSQTLLYPVLSGKYFGWRNY